MIMKTTYECVICLAINHVTKLHCSICGTIPAMYSVINAPARIRDINTQFWFYDYIPVTAAFGCARAQYRRGSRQNLFTVDYDTYADA